MKIEDYGIYPLDMADDRTGIPARITAVHRNSFAVVSEKGFGFARLKTGNYYDGKEGLPTTGDFVQLDWQQDGESRILKTLPRRTYFTRRDPSAYGGEQGVAANFDYVFILQSLDRDFNTRRLERYLALAWQSGATPVVLLTKSDGIEDCSAFVLAAEQMAVGVDVFAVSGKTGAGIEQLKPFMKRGKTIVILGSSGVGKSTLINTLAGEAVMTTGETRKKDGRGRHTTSYRQLILLKSGVMVIDTPGMREIGMGKVDDGLEQSFSDVEQHLGQCKFRDCKHQSEPGCAVKLAIKEGKLSTERWESYQKLLIEARFMNDKAGYLQEKKNWYKTIVKMQKEQKMLDYRRTPCVETFVCKACGMAVAPEAAGSRHRNHCPKCLTSIHLDNRPGDRESLCKGRMEPIGVWVRKNGEWAVVHQCQDCGVLSSNRIAADDNPQRLMAFAMRPLTMPLPQKEKFAKKNGHKMDGKGFCCEICGAFIVVKEQNQAHCPHCLGSIHKTKLQRGGFCKGRMDPVGIWIRETGEWKILHRCRSCGTLVASAVAGEDNQSLLLSIAMKPLAAPPFPLWGKGI